MAEGRKSIRESIDRHLREIGTLEELTDERYHATHERFEAASDQRDLILDWFGKFAGSSSFPSDRATRILSVGCGGGVMDQRITDMFAEHVSRLSLVGVDPNPQHTEAFETLFAAEGFEVEVFTGMFEEYETEKRFDVIHLVHCLYYFEHIAPELAKAVEMLAPGGSLVILQAPNEDLNHLADRAWKKQFDQSAWYSDDVQAALKKLGLRADTQRIRAHVDVTECFDPESRLGTEILDFIVQADTSRFTAAFQSSLRESLHAICTRRGKRMVAEHPVDAIVVQNSTDT